jgi:membrane-anchored glycerophosphoryl diester phosphodiesterase (GDPDase)
MMNKTKTQIVKDSFQITYQLYFKLILPALLAALFAKMILYLNPQGTHELKHYLTYFLMSLLMAFFSCFFWSMMLKIISIHDQKNYLSSAFNSTCDKIGEIILATILMYLSVVIGFILLIIPGFYIGVMNFCVLPLIILDNQPIKQAFRTSWFLVRGNWWHVFLSYSYAILVPAIIVIIIRFIGILFFPLIINEILFIVIKAALLPYVVVLIFVIYDDLKIRKNLS